MENEAKYNFQELDRFLLLANTRDEVEREKSLYEAKKKVEELKRIFKEKTDE